MCYSWCFFQNNSCQSIFKNNYLFCACMNDRNFTTGILHSGDNQFAHWKNISFLVLTGPAAVVTAIIAERGHIKRLLMSERNFIGTSAFYSQTVTRTCFYGCCKNYYRSAFWHNSNWRRNFRSIS